MIQSMTGFGKATCELGNKKITIEIKSLNSKQLDIFSRIPGIYKEKDLEIRSLISKTLKRGKVEFSMYMENLGGDSNASINKSVVEKYVEQIKEIAASKGLAEPINYFETILKLPDALKTEIQEIDEEEWHAITLAIDRALNQLIAFRITEGSSIKADLTEKINSIKEKSLNVVQYESERIETLRSRITENLNDLQTKPEFDKDRFEQEMIYYIEKFDINEEKVRLAHHLSYFLETMENKEQVGKKLGFIAQEIGREINTMGSKANHNEIQRLVILMKDDLEKIKEQILNAL